MNKIVYILKTKLHYYPPCVSQIRMIKQLGYDVDVVYGTCHEKTLKLLEDEGIKCYKISNLKDENPKKIEKIISWLKFRYSLSKFIKDYDRNNTLFWFGTAESVIPMLGKLRNYNYNVTLLELLDNDKIKRLLLKSIMSNAKKVACCEETRAWIMKYWFSLKELPYVFPNKSYQQITARRVIPSTDMTSKIIDDIKDSNILLSQGVLQTPDELIEFAKALNHTKKRYKFVLMGIDKYHCVDTLREYYDDIYYVEYVPAPLHLEITSYARIGINFYRPDCLNKAFCAPNKIYEFSGFGIPIIGNKIPGLVNTIGVNNAGICVDLIEKNIVKAINEIDDNYEKYSKNAKKFFDGTDNLESMKKLLEEEGIKKYDNFV